MKEKPKTELLTAEQERLLGEVRGYKDQLKQWDGKPVVTLEKNSKFKDFLKYDYPDFLKAVRIAAKAGLRNHPDIAPYIDSLRVLGEWDELRKSKGLEVGVKRPMTHADVEFCDYVSRRRKEGASDKTIRLEMIKGGKISEDYSQQSFSKHCIKLGIFSRKRFSLMRRG